MSETVPLQKRKTLRLKGRKLIELYRAVYERDGGCCVYCGKWIEPGTIPHHKVKKSQGGSDTLDNLEMCCTVCHGKEHHLNIIEGE